MSPRRGLSLVELTIALLIAGIIGLALTRFVVSQARFISLQDGLMRARAGARAGLNVLVQEIRMVGPGGLVSAAADSIEARVPYAMGIGCAQYSGGYQGVLLMPYDSANFAAATLDGFAWMDTTGVFNFTSPATVAVSTSYNGYCSATPTPPLTILPGWRAARLSPSDPTTPIGFPIYLYQTVRYTIAPSADLPGRLALWRTVVGTGARDELVVPFDTASRFRFLLGSRLAASDTVPAVLDSVRGLRVRFVGLSEDPPQGRTQPSRFDLTTDIVFVNRAH